MQNEIKEEIIENIKRVFLNFLGKNERQLLAQFGINEKNKSRYSQLTSKILSTGKLSAKLLKQSNLIVKTIRVQQTGKMKESISFPYFSFDGIITQDWFSSDLRKSFYDKTFVFVVFQENQEGIYTLSKIKTWSISLEQLDTELRNTWSLTKELIASGHIVKSISHQKSGKVVYHTYFPGSSSNDICHVRPHAANFRDQKHLPVPDILTGMDYYMKQSFWLNNTFIEQVISEQ
jgi:DNA mismatch repair protein MutH